jgi:hypothetical protein
MMEIPGYWFSGVAPKCAVSSVMVMSLRSKWAAGGGSIRILRVPPTGWKPMLL